MQITIYELLGMIKDGKAPKKIKYIDFIWEYDKEIKDYFHNDLWLIYSMNSIGLMKREVEILEEKKIPKKLDFTFEDGFIKKHFKSGAINYLPTFEAIKQLYNKQCEIIDYLKSKGE